MRVLSRMFAAIVAVACGAASVQAAFIVEPGAGGKATANFSSTDGVPSFSTTVGTAVGLSGVNSAFGGSGTIDEWVYSYTPGVDADNTVIAPGTQIGTASIAPPGNPAGVTLQDQFATGLTGGVSGTYNVYITSIASGNVNPAGSTVTVTSDGMPIVITPVDFNSTAANGPTPSGVAAANQWLLLGSVDLTAGNTYTVTQLANAPTFVGQRGAGVMWELVTPAGGVIPEPSSIALVGLAVAGLGLVARRRAA